MSVQTIIPATGGRLDDMAKAEGRFTMVMCDVCDGNLIRFLAEVSHRIGTHIQLVFAASYVVK